LYIKVSGSSLAILISHNIKLIPKPPIAATIGLLVKDEINIPIDNKQDDNNKIPITQDSIKPRSKLPPNINEDVIKKIKIGNKLAKNITDKNFPIVISKIEIGEENNNGKV
jgi:hypothetical protein